MTKKTAAVLDEQGLTVSAWMSLAERQVRRIVTKHGWRVDRVHRAETESRYLTLRHDGGDVVVVRIADHGTREKHSMETISCEPRRERHALKKLDARMQKTKPTDGQGENVG